MGKTTSPAAITTIGTATMATAIPIAQVINLATKRQG
jgi:hypothetical protein